MMGWMSGYAAGIDYTYGYHPETNPVSARFALAANGLMCRNFSNACELGYGQGLGINIHAAASKLNWWGTDYSPSQASFAIELSRNSQSSIQLYGDSFSEFCTNSELPNFDFIAVHGVWSWIAEKDRAILVDFLRRKLNFGGVVMMSYNTLPGWTAFSPIRKLMYEHSKTLGARGKDLVLRFQEATAFIEEFLNTNPAILAAHPGIAKSVADLKTRDKRYLVHEYFNENSVPMFFSDIARNLAEAKLDFACSVSEFDHIDAVNLTEEQSRLLRSIPDTNLYQTVRDSMINRQFRKDYWVKGLRRFDTSSQISALNKEQIILVTPREQIDLKIRCVLGEATLNEKMYTEILACLDDHQVHAVEEISLATSNKKISHSELVECLLTLSHLGHVKSVANKTPNLELVDQTKRLNMSLIKLSRGEQLHEVLASPVTGGGIAVSRTQQLMLLGIESGITGAEGLAQFVWGILSQFGQRITKDGRTLLSEEENIAALKESAENLLSHRMEILRNLCII